MHYERRDFWRNRPLIALTVGLPVAEAVVLLLLDIPSGFSVAPQVTAVGPFGAFHDLRWLFVFHGSILSFALGLATLVVLRSLLTALVVLAAWPSGVERPSLGVALVRSAVVTFAAVVLLSPWVTLLFGAAVVPLSWVFFAAVPPAIATILLIHHGGIDGEWWRRLPPLRSAGWAGLTFVVLSLAALSVAGRSDPSVFLIIAAVGVFNAWVWHHSVRTIVLGLPARRRRMVPVTAVVIVAMLVVVVGGTRLGFAAFASEDPGGEAQIEADKGGPTVLLVAGFASGCCEEAADLAAAGPEMTVEQFSYVGIDDQGRPVAHPGMATDADIADLAVLMNAQVAALAQRHGEPVAIVAESEGALVTIAFLNRYPDSSVDRLVLLSPIVEPGRVTYPDWGEEGRGVVAGYQLRAMAALIDSLAPIELSADGPFTDSLRRDAEELARALYDWPGMEEVVILPLADAVTNPSDLEYGDVEVVVVPGFHGGLRGRQDVQEMIATWVQGGDIPSSEVWLMLERIITGTASAWQVPGLESF
jgi:alpha-beta hydrolase superfamily lysophospholipase